MLLTGEGEVGTEEAAPVQHCPRYLHTHTNWSETERAGGRQATA